MRGARDLISVALQYGNAFGQGLQAAALKPADFFGNDDVLYLMEDMATGEIRLSILWEWLHKNAAFTADDESGVQAGDRLTPELFARLLAEEYEKLLNAGNRDVHDDSKNDDAADRARDRRDLRHAEPQAAVVHRSAEHQSEQHRPGGSAAAHPVVDGGVRQGRPAGDGESGLLSDVRRVVWLPPSGGRLPPAPSDYLQALKAPSIDYSGSPGFRPLKTANRYQSDGIRAAAPNGNVSAVSTSVALGAALAASVRCGAIR